MFFRRDKRKAISPLAVRALLRAKTAPRVRRVRTLLIRDQLPPLPRQGIPAWAVPAQVPVLRKPPYKNPRKSQRRNRSLWVKLEWSQIQKTIRSSRLDHPNVAIV